MAWNNPQLSKVLGRLSLSKIGWDVRGRGTTGEPTVMTIKDTAGVTWYIFVTTTGQIAISSTLPTADTAATDYGTLFKVERTLTTAEVNALHTTPITLVAAQGATKVILPVHLMAEYTYNTTQFTIGGSDVFAVGYTGGSTTNSIAGTGFVDQTSSAKRGNNSTATTYTAVANTLVRVTNTGTAFSGGGTSTVKLTLLYRVITIS